MTRRPTVKRRETITLHSINSFFFKSIHTVVGSSPKKNGLSAKMSDSTLMSRLPNSSISSGLCTPMPCALTFLIPWNH